MPRGAPAWSDDEVQAFVAAAGVTSTGRDELVALLREDSPVFEGRGATTATRRRGWMLASFGACGLPPAAVPYVLEDLQNELDPYGVAAAARAVRGMERPTPEVAAALVDALVRMRARDDTVTFESLRPTWPPAEPTTTLGELLAAICHAGAAADGQRDRLLRLRDEHAGTWSTAVQRALDVAIAAPPHDCCASRAVDARPVGGDERPDVAPPLAAIELEDQDGRRLNFDEFLAGRRGVVAFFYTRCPNPNKCSLTITKLGELQRRLESAGHAETVCIAGITYDPGFDLPARLHRYGASRGVRFTSTARLLRAVACHDDLRRAFQLRVGYTGSIVNRHAIELFLVDGAGAISTTWTRRQWDVDDVLSALVGG